MTNELEKQFFDTFGIEQRGKKCTCDVRDFAKCTTYYCTSCAKALKKEYPRITPEILLELMFLITDINTNFELRNIRNVTALKTAILEFFIKKYGNSQNRKILKHQVRKLFEER